MTSLHYFRSGSNVDLGAFAADPSGARLPPEQGPWRLVRSLVPEEGWTDAADLGAVKAGIATNGFFLVDGPGDLVFRSVAVPPAD